MVILQRFLYKSCDCVDYMVIVNCSDTGRSNTVYSIQFIGSMADDLLTSWLLAERNSGNEIDLGVATFILCDQTCSGVETEIMPGNNKGSLQHIHIFMIVIIIIIIMIIVAIACIIYCCYKQNIR